MFTGLIEEIGTVKSIVNTSRSSRITINVKNILNDVRLGDSISTNGVCLTVTDFGFGSFTVDVMPETMRKTNLKNLRIGDRVNLERALRPGDRLGGHFVTGHIDGVGTIKAYEREDIATWVTIEAPEEILKYVVYKGSIAIDGISLTVAHLKDAFFKVSIIPHTGKATILLEKNIGDEVNIECDILGKYVEKFMMLRDGEGTKVKKEISFDFLKENGFL